MNLRQKKKHRIGPFRESGVKIDLQLAADSDALEFLDQFLRRAIEATGCFFGGSIDSRTLQLRGVVELGRGCAHAPRQDALARWLQQHPSIATFHFSTLIDLSSATAK